MSSAAQSLQPAAGSKRPAVMAVAAQNHAGATPGGDHFSALQAIGTVAHFSRNATIFTEGDEANFSYRVVSGTVRLCKMMSDGRRQIAEFLVAGDFFGFEWLKTYSLTAEALSDVAVVRYARSRLDRLGEEHGDVQRGLMALLSRDLWTAQNHLVMLGRKTAQERVVSFFLALAERTGAGNGDALDVSMGRQDIADYLGLTIETVCRSISELKRARLIGVPNRRQIVLRDIEKLREIAEGEFCKQ